MNKLKSHLDKYQVHYFIGALVYLSFAISGFKFDIVESSTLTLLIYGFLQVFSLIIFLALTKDYLLSIKKKEIHPILFNLKTIFVGTFFAFLFDFIIIYVFEMIDPSCKFQIIFSDQNINKIIKSLLLTYLEDLQYPIVFWPLCEFAHKYLKNLTINNETKIQDDFKIEDLKFLKVVPKSQRKNILAIEAQQNYIQLIYPNKSYTVLYRLKDAIAEIPKDFGMKVHRSYWVAFNGIERVSTPNSLKLINGKEIPVSRTFASQLKMDLDLKQTLH